MLSVSSQEEENETEEGNEADGGEVVKIGGKVSAHCAQIPRIEIIHIKLFFKKDAPSTLVALLTNKATGQLEIIQKRTRTPGDFPIISFSKRTTKVLLSAIFLFLGSKMMVEETLHVPSGAVLKSVYFKQ